MKILAIRLKNLASLEGEVEIDFENKPLKSTGLFTISGPTGSGKSTILDALCLALYDATPRFKATTENVLLQDVGESKINQLDVRNILRRGTGEGYAEVDFIGSDNYRYRSRWLVRRAYGKPDGALQSQVMVVKNLTTDTELQGTKKELLEQLVSHIGLTYEQFTRTVLLAQNEFSTFLKSKEGDKAELLEKLTGTEIYSRISQEIFQRTKKETNAFMQLQENLIEIKILEESELITYLSQEAELNEKIKQTTKIIEELNKQAELLQRLDECETEEKEKKRLIKAETEKANKVIKDLENQDLLISEFKRKKVEIQPDIEKAQRLDVQLESKQEEIKKEQVRLSYLLKEKEEIEKKHRRMEKEIDSILTVLASTFDVKEEQSYSLFLHLLSEKNDEIIEKEKKNKALLDEITAYKIDELGGVQSFLLEQENEKKQLKRQYIEWLELVKKIANEKKQLQEYREKLQRAKEKLDVELENKKKQDEAYNKIKELYEQQKIAIGKNVKTLRGTLKQEYPCPVCGSTEHPYFNSEEVNLLFHKIKHQYKDSEKDLKEVVDVINKLNSSINKLTIQEKNSSELLDEYLEKENKQKPKNKKGDIEYYNKLLKKIVSDLKEVKSKISKHNELQKLWNENTNKLAKQRKSLEELKKRIEELKIKQVEFLSINENLKAKRKDVVKQQKEFENSQTQWSELQKSRKVLLKGKKVKEALSSLDNYEKKLTDEREQLCLSIDKMKQEISSLKGQHKQLKKQLEELEIQRRKIKKVENLSDEIKKKLHVREQDNEKLIQVKTILNQDKNNRKRKEKESNKLKKKEIIVEKWSKLDNLFGSADGKRFKVIAQGYTLNLLLRYANKHLAYLAQRYELKQVSNQLTLQVVDRFMLDEVRTVHSLSGGESFLVSLALALGLSSLSSKNLNVDSLFIDEGFGSLDVETLNIAMEALEQLQMQGRKIGVISHVQEMSERIPTQIKIKKERSGRSSVSIIG